MKIVKEKGVLKHGVEHKERLQHALSKLRLQMSDLQQQKMLTYLQELMRWNKTYNLTAIRDVDQALVQHVFDSLTVVKPLIEHFESREIDAPKIMDVGSGAGLPGVILAIGIPYAQVTCIDAVDKKISFIRQMKGTLGLQNLECTHARIEEIEPGQFDTVISRAFSSVSDFVGLAGKHVVKGGSMIAMKGKRPDEEMKALSQQTQWTVVKIEDIEVPELNAERCLVWLEDKENK